MASFPFELLVAACHVARMIVVEKQPAPAFRVCDMAVGIGNPDPGLDCCACVARQAFEITPLRLRSAPPRHGHRTMAGNRSVGMDGGQLRQSLQPTNKAAINYWDAIDKEEVGQPEGPRIHVEDRQIVVGMSRPVSPDDQRSSPEIEVKASGN